MTAMLRWQNDQGMRMREEYIVTLSKLNGSVVCNPPELIKWLIKPVNDGGDMTIDRDHAKQIRKLAFEAMDKRLAALSNTDLHPESRQLINAGWLSP